MELYLKAMHLSSRTLGFCGIRFTLVFPMRDAAYLVGVPGTLGMANQNLMEENSVVIRLIQESPLFALILEELPVKSVLERLRESLTTAGVAFEERHHEAVFTSEAAAAVRRAELASGAKALMVKAGLRFLLLVIPADRKLDSKLAKRSLKIKDLRFATAEELLQLTGLKPGAVPPFGSLFGIPTIVDPALSEQERINFNAGDHCVSFGMKWPDYQGFVKPELAVLSVSAQEKTAGPG